MIGLVEDDTVRSVRDDVIAAADATERQLRDRAAEASTLIRARRRAAADVAGQLDGTIAALRQEIENGVAGYGRLLKAIGEARHQSCLVVTSREKPSDLDVLGGGAVAYTKRREDAPTRD